MRFTNTITIQRSPVAVFNYLADLENLPRWNYAIQQTRKITAGPVGPGSRYLQTRTIPVHREEALEVVDFDPDRALTIRGSLNSLPALISYTLRPHGSATDLTNTVNLELPRALKPLAPIATREVRSAVAANLEVLKKALER